MNVGVSVTRHDALYGVPIRFSLDPDVEAEAPTIDVKQTRYDARAEIPLSGFFSQVRARGGYSRLSPPRDRGHRRDRVDLLHQGGEGRRRAGPDRARRAGAEPAASNISTARSIIDGEEKFLPDSKQRQTGLFTMQSLVRGPLRLEGGVRVEFSKLDRPRKTTISARPR